MKSGYVSGDTSAYRDFILKTARDMCALQWVFDCFQMQVCTGREILGERTDKDRTRTWRERGNENVKVQIRLRERKGQKEEGEKDNEKGAEVICTETHG